MDDEAIVLVDVTPSDDFFLAGDRELTEQVEGASGDAMRSYQVVPQFSLDILDIFLPFLLVFGYKMLSWSLV